MISSPSAAFFWGAESARAPGGRRPQIQRSTRRRPSERRQLVYEPKAYLEDSVPESDGSWQTPGKGVNGETRN